MVPSELKEGKGREEKGREGKGRQH